MGAVPQGEEGRYGMTVIYVDTLFLLNAMMDYLLLLASARLAGEPLTRLRFLAGAAAGGLYAVAIFLPGLEFLQLPPCRLAAMAGMLLLAFGGSRRLGRLAALFLVLSCALGGGVMLVSQLGGRGLSLGRGVLYSGMDLKIVLLAAAGCFAALTLLFSRGGQHWGRKGQLCAAALELEGRRLELTALVDTGNTLSDPVTGRPVAVAEGAALAPLLPRELGWLPGRLSDPAGAMARLGDGPWAGRFRLLPYRAVGVERGLLLALRLDGLAVGKTRRKAPLVALSPTPVSDGGNYRLLLGGMERSEWE